MFATHTSVGSRAQSSPSLRLPGISICTTTNEYDLVISVRVAYKSGMLATVFYFKTIHRSSSLLLQTSCRQVTTSTRRKSEGSSTWLDIQRQITPEDTQPFCDSTHNTYQQATHTQGNLQEAHVHKTAWLNVAWEKESDRAREGKRASEEE